MPQDQFLSVSDIVQELNAGKGVIKFILRKFQNHIPFEEFNGQDYYPVHALTIISNIMEKLNMGTLPSKILDELGGSTKPEAADAETALKNDIRISHDGLYLIKSLFNDIGEQQKRIAIAHEKRAEAEERKASAIEKRAEAEEKKAQAMNNIANALQEMNRLRSPIDPAAQQIAHEAVQVMTTEEQTIDLPDVEDLLGEDFDDALSSFIEEDELPDEGQTKSEFAENDFNAGLDDLSALIEEPAFESKKEIDDPDDLLNLADDDDESNSDMDDLSELLDAIEIKTDNNTHPDDLSALIDDTAKDPFPDTAPSAFADDMDDLSLLIHDHPVGQNKPAVDTIDPVEDMDDLSKLIEQSNAEDQHFKNDSQGAFSDPGMDDLSMLIDDPGPELKKKSDGISPESDNGPVAQEESIEMDDLTLLIDREKNKMPSTGTQDARPEEKPRIEKITIPVSPDDVQNYKAAVMKTLISLKNEGKTPEQTTQIFNENKIQTISGKPQWSLKAVSQIYGFIESAR